MEQCLTIGGKSHEKYFGGRAKLRPKLGFLSFFQVCIINFA